MRRSWAAALTFATVVACGESRSNVVPVGGSLSMSPAQLDFGDVALGRSASQTVTLQNVGIAALEVAQLTAVVDPAFVVTGLPLTLGPSATAQVTVKYQPPQLGPSNSALQMQTDTTDNPLATLPLHGNAVRGLAMLSGDTFDFGDVVVNETAVQDLSLVNNDGHAVTSVAIGAPTPGDAFQVAREGSFTLSAEQSMVVELTFKPPAVGDFSAVVAVTPCPTCSARNIQLLGHGVTQLLDVEPASIDFGYVLLGRSAQKGVTLTNLSRSPLTLSAISTGDPSLKLSLVGAAVPLVLAPGQQLAGTLTWAPVALGPLAANVTMTVSDGAAGVIAVTGMGVGPVLQATPKSLYVGAAALGTTRTGTITITNVGLDPSRAYPLQLLGVHVVSSDGSFSVPNQTGVVGEPGASVSLPISFAPATEGTASATLAIDSNDALQPHLEVPLAALGRSLLPCQLAYSENPVDFGPAQLFQPTVQGFTVTNQTADDCIVGNPVLSGDAAFSWPGGVVPAGRTMPSGAHMSVRVQFAPQAAQRYSASVTFYVSNKAAPSATVQLTGAGDGSCFFLSPGTTDFGGTALGCGPQTQNVFAVNHCAGPVTVRQVQTIDAAFTSAATPPYTIDPQSNVALPVTYQATTVGDDVGALLVSTSLGQYRAGLTGGAQTPTTVFDQWTQSTPKVDMLLVIDNSGSMTEEQHALQQNLDALWNRIALANADYHIAVTTTGMFPYSAGYVQCPGGAQGGEAGRFFPVDGSEPRILTPQTPNVKQALFSNIIVGTCHYDERFLEPVVAALTPPLSVGSNAGFLRDDARLALMAVSDADDDSDVARPPPVSQYVQQIAAVKHGALDLVSFSGIVALSPCATVEQIGTRYKEIARELNGHLYDICQLANMGSLLDSALGDLLLPLTSFPLSAKPKDPSAIQVTVNGSASTDWTYDAGSNRIVFPRTDIPPPGSIITAQYEPACG
jgi:hypothetical protein